MTGKPVGDIRVEAGDVGARESDATAKPLLVGELLLCIFFAIALVVTICT